MPLDSPASISTERPKLRIRFPPKFRGLFTPRQDHSGVPVRYRVGYGGRGGAKSRSFARALIGESLSAKHLILCTREFQNSIADSVHRQVVGQIQDLNLSHCFDVTQSAIRCYSTGSEFIFKGLRRNIQEIRSLEGVTRVWIEEGHSTSKESLQLLDPTIRAPGSEIWVAFNPVDPGDPVYDTWVGNPAGPPPGSIVLRVGWQDNPWFPPELDRLRRYHMQADPDAYDWIWEGICRKIGSAVIFKDRYVIEGFETPSDVDRFFYGVDWGFANDPLVGLRCFIQNDELYIDYEVCGIGIEVDEIPAFLIGGTSPRSGTEFAGLPGIKDWPVKADNSRPETISYVGRHLNIQGAEKWAGSVEDGITHLKGFRKIHIHERCVNMGQEARLYSYKVDQRSRDVLPIVVDKFNHGWDSARYALDGYIQKRGFDSVWLKL